MDRNQDGICQYVVLEGEAGHQDAIVRTECSVNMLHRVRCAGRKARLCDRQLEPWHRRRQRWLRCWRSTPGQMELILANNDDMALGAIDALKASGLSRGRMAGGCRD